MTIPADIVIAQNQVLYRKTEPPGGQPTIFTVRCNCGSSPSQQTSRFVSANRHLFLLPQDFKDGKWL